MGMCDGTKDCICDWCENTPTEIEQLRAEVAMLREQVLSQRKCGLCMEGKPCNWEECPDDVVTVHATEWNGLIASVTKAEVTIERLRVVLKSWIELEDESKPWHGTEAYFDEYERRFAMACEALKDPIQKA